MSGELTKPALAELKEQGATADGDDAGSVAAAAMLAVDLAAEEIDFSKARILAICFEENGDVCIYSVSDKASGGVRAALKAEGIEEGLLAAADMEKAFGAAVESEDEERLSVPPPAPEEMK